MTASQINTRIAIRIGRPLDQPYDGPDLPDAEAEEEIRMFVEAWRDQGDTLVLPTSPMVGQYQGDQT